jgi:hypothetical protein
MGQNNTRGAVESMWAAISGLERQLAEHAAAKPVSHADALAAELEAQRAWREKSKRDYIARGGAPYRTKYS